MNGVWNKGLIICCCFPAKLWAWIYQAGLPEKHASSIARWQMMLDQHREMFIQHLWMCVFTTQSPATELKNNTALGAP